jgi:hypothetical protein
VREFVVMASRGSMAREVVPLFSAEDLTSAPIITLRHVGS